MNEDNRKGNVTKNVENRKDAKYNIPENAVETLLENVLTGRTVVLPSEVFRTVTPRYENSTLSLANKREKVANEVPTKGAVSKSVCEKENLGASGDNDLNSWIKLNGSKDQDSVFMISDAAVERVENNQESDENEGKTTRPVTPTGMRPVSEQYIQAKRILNSNPYGVEPPVFQNLPVELEEAFTLSAAYVAQLIISSSSQLNYKLDKLVKNLPSVVNEPIATPSEVAASQTAEIAISSTPKNDSTIEKSSAGCIVTNVQKPTKQNSEIENGHTLPKPVYDVFAAFEAYLQRIKMPVPEVNAHLNHVRILSNKEASKYMAKFGFTPKKKK